MTDAYITEIGFIKPWPTTFKDGTPLPENMRSDNLELAYIKNWQCVIKKGEFTRGEKVLYIQPDAQIAKEGTPWADGIRSYLSGSGRVKIAVIRKQISNGIILKLSEVADFLDENDVCGSLKIKHYEAPAPQCLEAKSGNLPPGIEKSDEENYQSLDDAELRLGEKALMTRKIDGSSAIIYFHPEEDEIRICSRSMELRPELDNNYTKACRPYFDSVRALAKMINSPVCIRGEVYGNGLNANKANLDAKKPLGFAVYGVRLPERFDDLGVRYGCWGSDWHFTKLNDLLAEAEEKGFGKQLKRFETVPVLGEVVITKELLEEYEQKPAEDGEGVVFNFTYCDGLPRSYKDKSAAYYAKMK